MSMAKTLRSWRVPGVWLWLVPLLLLGGGFIAFRSMMSASEQAQTEEVVQAPQQVTVAALGRLEPEGEVVVVGGPNTDRIARLEVAEGDFVEQGTILAYLESYEERKAERDYAASQLTEAQSKLQAETQLGRAQIQEAQTRLQQVDRPELFEIQSQQAAVRQLEAELSLAQADLERSQSLFQEGAISRQELDNQITENRRVEEQLNSARADLVRLEASRSTNLGNARAQVQSQEATLQRSQSQVEVESTARNLQLAEARLDRTIIRAPQNGEVLRVLSQSGEAISEDGILELGNTRQMFVVAEVYETDVQRVRVGQRATIVSRNGAFDETLLGRVERVGSQIFKNNVLDDDPAANADARIVEVKIRLDNSEAVAQLTNLQVDVRIDVE